MEGKIKDDVIICKCNSPNHKIIIRKDTEDIYVYFFLGDFPFFKRLILGLRYIFKLKNNYGNFEEFILPNDEQTINKLEEILKELNNNKLIIK